MRTFFRIGAIAAALAACVLLAGAAAAQDDYTPTIGVGLGGDTLWGGGFPPSAEIALAVRAAPGAEVLETATTVADDTGWFDLGDTQLATDLRPGMEVTAAAGALSAAVTLVPLAFDLLDPTHGVAAGTAPPGATVLVRTWQGQDAVALETTTGPDGRWRADFAAARLPLGSSATAEVRDDEGDSTVVDGKAPTLGARYSYDAGGTHVGLGGYGWTPGSSVQVEVLSAPEGELLWSGTAPTETGEHEWERPGDWEIPSGDEQLGVDLVPGLHVRATDVTTGVVKELTLLSFGVDRVDPVENAASGTALPGARVLVDVEDAGMASTTTDGSGVWRVQFDPEQVQLTWWSWAEAIVEDGDGDEVRAGLQPPTVAAWPVEDLVTGAAFAPGGAVAVEVLDADGTVVWSTSAAGRWFAIETGVDLAPGQSVRVTDATTGLVKTLAVVPLTVDVLDPLQNTVSGTGAPGSTLRLFGSLPGDGGEIADVGVDEDGTWSYDLGDSGFAGGDVTAQWHVGAYVADAEADVTIAEIRPPVEAIPELRDEVTALVAAGELPRTAGRVLTATLDSALASLTGSTSSPRTLASTSSDRSERSERVGVKLAIVKLRVFELEVKALARSHRLAPAPAAELAAAARRIRVGLGG